LNSSTDHEIFAFYATLFSATMEQFGGIINDFEKCEDNSNCLQEDCEIFFQAFLNFFS